MPTSRKAPAATPFPGGLNPGVLRDNISYLTRAVRAVVQQNAPDDLEEGGLLAGQLAALALIAANEGVSQNDLARAMLMKKSQVTAVIQDLVVRGHVDRLASATDRRYNALSLTAQGTALWKRSSERMVKHSDAVMKPLAAAERRELLRLLQKLVGSHLSEP